MSMHASNFLACLKIQLARILDLTVYVILQDLLSADESHWIHDRHDNPHYKSRSNPMFGKHHLSDCTTCLSVAYDSPASTLVSLSSSFRLEEFWIELSFEAPCFSWKLRTCRNCKTNWFADEFFSCVFTPDWLEYYWINHSCLILVTWEWS